MATYTLTPARRAALRKAQLASAAKRRRHGTVPQTLRRSIGQRTGYAKASFQVKSRDFQKGSKVKKGLKYAAVGLGAAAAVGAYSHATAYDRMYKHNQQAKTARKASRFLPSTHPVSRRLAKSAMMHQNQAMRIQKRHKL